MMSELQSTSSEFPLVVPSRSQAPIARLLLRNDLGQIVQQWLIKENKCTLGSASGCSLRCQVPGIAPYHAILVIGAKRSFVRALAPRLSRGGVPSNELLLSNDESGFELAGHSFELSCEVGSGPAEDTSERLRFTLARPFALQNKSPLARPAGGTEERIDNLNSDTPTRSGTPDTSWVAKLVQSAIEPLECQIQNILEPISELQAVAQQQRMVLEQQSLHEDQSQSASVEELLRANSENLDSEFDQFASQQSAALDSMNERISDVTNQLSTIERIIAEEAKPLDESAVERIVDDRATEQTAAVHQLQQGMVSVSDAIQKLRADTQEQQQQDADWKEQISQQIQELNQSLQQLSDNSDQSWRDEISAEVSELKSTIQTWQDQPSNLPENQVAWQSQVQEEIQQVLEAVRTTEDPEARQWHDQLQSQVSELRTTIESFAEQTKSELQSLASRAETAAPKQEDDARDAAWRDEIQQQFRQIQDAVAALAARPTIAPPPDNQSTDLGEPPATGSASEGLDLTAVDSEDAPIGESVNVDSGQASNEDSEFNDLEFVSAPVPPQIDVDTTYAQYADEAHAEDIQLFGEDGLPVASWEAESGSDQDGLGTDAVTYESLPPGLEIPPEIDDVDAESLDAAQGEDTDALDLPIGNEGGESTVRDFDPSSLTIRAQDLQNAGLLDEQPAQPFADEASENDSDDFPNDAAQQEVAAALQQYAVENREPSEFDTDSNEFDTKEPRDADAWESNESPLEFGDADEVDTQDEQALDANETAQAEEDDVSAFFGLGQGSDQDDAQPVGHVEESGVDDWDQAATDESDSSPDGRGLGIQASPIVMQPLRPATDSLVTDGIDNSDVDFGANSTALPSEDEDANTPEVAENSANSFAAEHADANVDEEFAGFEDNVSTADDPPSLEQESDPGKNELPSWWTNDSDEQSEAEPQESSAPPIAADNQEQDSGEIQEFYGLGNAEPAVPSNSLKDQFEPTTGTIEQSIDDDAWSTAESATEEPFATGEGSSQSNWSDSDLSADSSEHPTWDSEDSSSPQSSLDDWGESSDADALDARLDAPQDLDEEIADEHPAADEDQLPHDTADALLQESAEDLSQEVSGDELASEATNDLQSEASDDEEDPEITNRFAAFAARLNDSFGETEDEASDNDAEPPASPTDLLGALRDAASDDDGDGQGETALEAEPMLSASIDPVAELEEPSKPKDEDGEDSVEDYMQKLLARMRGEPEPEPDVSDVNESTDEASTTSGSDSTDPLEAPAINSRDLEIVETVQTPQIDPALKAGVMDFAPRAAAPELGQNLAAMRELANSSARTAINKSTRKRHASGLAVKAVIACIGFTVGGVLLAINGLAVNIGLIATVAAFLVGGIWGYDAFATLKPLLQSRIVLEPQQATAPVQQPVREDEASVAEDDES